MNARCAVLIVLAVAPPAAAAELRFDEYIALVARANVGLAAQRAGVAIAEAQIEVAKLFPEPTLTAGAASFDIALSGAPTVLTVGISETVELGGKRGARVAVAENGVVGARADVEDFFTKLRGGAADAFVDALTARHVLARKQLTLDSLSRLVSVNEQRFRAGDVGQVAVTQSRVEAGRFRGEVLLAQADIRNADLNLALHAGTTMLPAEPSGDLKLAPRTLVLADLVASARARRSDVRAARVAVEAGRTKIDLAQANRTIDLTFALGWFHSFEAGGAYAKIAPTPAVDALSVTLSVPLPLARESYRGELDGAIATRSQAELALKQAELKAEIEVRQALARYQATLERLELYTGGILTDADTDLDATTYNYRHGGATLLEVLEAQRTVDEVYLAYYQALADHAHALIAVEVAAAIWDIRF